MSDPSPDPSEDVRRAVFAALVEAQDRAGSVHDAKQEVVARFGLTWAMLEWIELEGLDNEWPPLGEAG
jgi:P2-related tail formation protein